MRIFETDDGITYLPMVEVDATENIQFAQLTQALGPPSEPINFWDRDNSITIRNLNHGTLTSLPEQDLPDSDGSWPRNVVAVADAAGNWEFLVVATWTDNGDGTWTGSTLLRGQWNSEAFMTHGMAGLEVFFPMESTITYQAVPDSWLGATRTFYGEEFFSEAEIGTRQLAIVGNAIKPYPVRNIRGAIISNDWQGEFDSQGLNTGPGFNLSDVGTGVEVLDFEVLIYSDDSFTTVNRTITTTASVGGSVITVASDPLTGLQAFTYSTADQASDFGGNQTTIHVGIAQIGNLGVKGPERQATLTG